MVQNHADTLAQRKPLVRPFLDGPIECSPRYVYVSNRSDGPTDVQGVLVPQLHAVAHIGDVVKVGVADLPQQLIDARMHVRKRRAREAGLGTQAL